MPDATRNPSPIGSYKNKPRNLLDLTAQCFIYWNYFAK